MNIVEIIRQKALVEGAFGKLVGRVNAPHSGNITENNFAGTNTDHRTVGLE